MQLTPREVERLLIFTAAELARRRLREGILLSHPGLRRAGLRRGAREGAARVRATTTCARPCTGCSAASSSSAGVPELLEEPLQVEATFGDGSRLVALEGLVAP